MSRDQYQAAVSAFIRSKGVTRCPTACVLPTQGTVASDDRMALRDYSAARRRSRDQRLAARKRPSWLGTAPDE